MDALDIAIAQQVAQRTQAWMDIRLGRFTGSEIFRLIGKPRTAGAVFTETAITYIDEKVAEVLTGQSKVVSTYATAWGTEHEPLAIAELGERGVDVKSVGFAPYGDHAGASADGLTILHGHKLVVEVKCPYESSNHVNLLKCSSGKDLKKAEPKYYWQTQMEILAHRSIDGNLTTGCLFVSFDPRVLDEARKLHFFFVDRDKEAEDLLVEKIGLAVVEKNRILSLPTATMDIIQHAA